MRFAITCASRSIPCNVSTEFSTSCEVLLFFAADDFSSLIKQNSVGVSNILPSICISLTVGYLKPQYSLAASSYSIPKYSSFIKRSKI